MNILMIVTGSTYCTSFYKIQEELEKENNVKILFTDVAKIIAEKDIEYYFMKYDRAIDIHGNNEKYINVSGKGHKYIDNKYEKFSCSFPVYRNNTLYYTNNDLEINSGIEYENLIYQHNNKIEHIELCNWADKMIIAPCTANTLNKIYQGIADSFIMTTILSFLGTSKTTYIAPAMNTDLWHNFTVKRSINELKRFNNIKIIYPTVNKLGYGDYGIGALANIKDMVNIINGHTWSLPFNSYYALNDECYNNIDWKEYLPKSNEPGSFGFINNNNINTGVDIYCKNDSSIYAMEDGEVIDVHQLNESYVINIKGKSGVISYGNILPSFDIYKGRFITAKTNIGKVITVLSKEINKNIRNYNNEMLHIELYENFEDGINLTWNLNENRHNNLLDPMIYLYNCDITS